MNSQMIDCQENNRLKRVRVTSTPHFAEASFRHKSYSFSAPKIRLFAKKCPIAKRDGRKFDK